MFFIEQLILACNPYLVFICILGTILGLLWGSMPGISTTMSMGVPPEFLGQLPMDIVTDLRRMAAAGIFGPLATSRLIHLNYVNAFWATPSKPKPKTFDEYFGADSWEVMLRDALVGIEPESKINRFFRQMNL